VLQKQYIDTMQTYTHMYTWTLAHTIGIEGERHYVNILLYFIIHVNARLLNVEQNECVTTDRRKYTDDFSHRCQRGGRLIRFRIRVYYNIIDERARARARVCLCISIM